MFSRTSFGWVSTSKPATSAVPLVGASSVHSMRTVVDLPAPFGPEEAVDLAAGDREVDAVDRVGVVEAPAEAGGAYRDVGHRRPLIRGRASGSVCI